MAQKILTQYIDPAILEDLAADICIDTYPHIEEQPAKLAAFTAATAVLIQPSLEALVESYRTACATSSGREAANRFLQNMLAAEA